VTYKPLTDDDMTAPLSDRYAELRAEDKLLALLEEQCRRANRLALHAQLAVKMNDVGYLRKALDAYLGADHDR
jgi:hypothetical protein